MEKPLLRINAEEIMSRHVYTVSPKATIGEVIDLILKQRANGIVVTDANQRVLGIVTRKDIAQMVQKGTNYNQPVSSVMTEDVITITPDEDVEKARDLMIKHGIGQIPVVNRQGRLIGCLTSDNLRDTYYMRLEEIGRHLRVVMDTVRAAICVVDAKGTVMYWNPSSEELYGIKAEKIIGRPLVEFFPNALLQKVVETGKGFDSIEHEPREGTHVVISATPIMKDGEIIGAVSTERDVTELINLSKELKKFRNQVSFLQEEIKKIRKERLSLENITGKSQKLQSVISLVKRVAKTDAAVLIRGESGTGKELIAHAIHLESMRRDRPFVVVDCSAIPATLLESELFGYEGGAFTGANRAGKLGKFELADGGTVLLDEIGEMSIEMQAKLLRVLQDKMFYRVGGVKPVKVNVRVIAATNRELEKMIKRGEFREDLYYRLDVVSIRLPALRERKEDIPILIDTFLKEFSGKYKKHIMRIEPEVMSALLDYDWPGNVRELKNITERLVVLTEDSIIRAEYLPEHLRQQTMTKEEAGQTVAVNKLMTLDGVVKEAEKQAILMALRQTRNNRSQAAKILGIPRSTLYYKMEELQINEK